LSELVTAPVDSVFSRFGRPVATRGRGHGRLDRGVLAGRAVAGVLLVVYEGGGAAGFCTWLGPATMVGTPGQAWAFSGPSRCSCSPGSARQRRLRRAAARPRAKLTKKLLASRGCWLLSYVAGFNLGGAGCIGRGAGIGGRCCWPFETSWLYGGDRLPSATPIELCWAWGAATHPFAAGRPTFENNSIRGLAVQAGRRLSACQGAHPPI